MNQIILIRVREIPKEVVERVKKHLDIKVKKFQTQLKDLNKANQLIKRKKKFFNIF